MMGSVFTRKALITIQDGVREKLEDAWRRGGEETRLRAIMDGIRTLEKPERMADLVTLYVWCLSLMVHSLRYGGVPRGNLARSIEMIQSVLSLLDTDHTQSASVGQMYGEFYTVLSQLSRSRGLHGQASWEFRIGGYMSRRAPPGGTGFVRLGGAIRALRLGQGELALAEFTGAEADLPAGIDRDRCRIGRIRALRLSGRHEEALALVRETLRDPQIEPNLGRECRWEEICLEVSRSGDLSGMILSVGRRGEHHRGVYLLEAWMWSLCSPERKWTGRLPKVSTMVRRKDAGLKADTLFLKGVMQLENCMNKDLPMIHHLNRISRTMREVGSFQSIDRELLYLLATGRWLARQRVAPFAAAVLGEYRGLCRKLSDGGSADVLGLAGDIYARSWFPGLTQPDGESLQEAT